VPVLERSTIPNAITVGRIILAPVVFFLVMTPAFTPRLLAFVLFLVAAFSDLWDGHLARKYGWISNFGKLVDPIADKLLLVATLVPFYLISRSTGAASEFPFFGVFPMWILIVIFGREVLITGMRAYAARRGVIIPAGRAGKQKAIFQNIFMGAGVAWYAALSLGLAQGWTGRSAWSAWLVLHAGVVLASLAIALFLTVYSLVLYLRNWRMHMRSAA
jgi:CDP-diacylglycerol---glycerol-3-phosphate 3-phosphatidyltransferase